MIPGEIITAFGEKFRILEVGPRSKWENCPGVTLLGQGIVALNLETGIKEYFYDFDVED